LLHSKQRVNQRNDKCVIIVFVCFYSIFKFGLCNLTLKLKANNYVIAEIFCQVHPSSYWICGYGKSAPSPPIDSIIRLMTVWRITGKIIRTAFTV